MRTPNNKLPADVRVICGAMGSGKSQGVKDQLESAVNVFVFDVKNEYGSIRGFKVASSRADLLKAAHLGGRWAFPGGASDFDYWCRVMWARGGAFLIAEELSSVTSPGKASGAWHLICTQGRGFGLRVAGITQRPAEIDKTIVGNASLFRCHRLSRAGDREYMARELDCDVRIIADLEGFDYIERKVYPPELARVTGRGTREILRKSASKLDKQHPAKPLRSGGIARPKR